MHLHVREAHVSTHVVPVHVYENGRMHGRAREAAGAA